MSGRRITELAVATSVDRDDLLPIVDMTGTPTTKRATVDLLAAVPYLWPVNERTADYTATLGDVGGAIHMDVASANTLTIVNDSTVDWPDGALIFVAQLGAGTTTLVAGSGVTLLSAAGLTLPGQNATALLRKAGPDEWVVSMLDFVPDPDAGLVLPNVQTDDYTLTLADAGQAVEIDSTDPENVTVPPESAVDFPVGTIIEVAQVGVGQVTIVEGAGVDVRTAETLVLRGQWSTVSLRKRDSDDWLLVGDVEEAP